MDQSIKKINIVYLLCYIFVPMTLISLGLLVGYYFFYDGGTGAVVCFMGPPLLAFLWWCFGGRLLYKQHRKKLIQELEEQGFTRNQTFDGRGATVMVDLNRGQLALLFFWNPFAHYVFPAKRVQRAWVDDGAGGAGFLRGSSRVSFLFQVDEVKVRVDTFTSNKRWRMDSNYILTGISKADVMVEVLEQAKQRSV